MKYPYILLTAALLTLTSCMQKRCYVCTVTQTVEPYGITDGSTHAETICDVTVDQMRAHEAAGTYVQTIDSITVTQTTRCR